MNYRSIADLDRDVFKWQKDLPGHFEVVVGIPRSGLLVANLISLYRNLSLTDVEGLVEGRLIKGGRRCAGSKHDDFLATPRKVLVVDDSVSSGRQMESVRQLLAKADLGHEISLGAVYIGTKQNKGDVDVYFRQLRAPRCFGWNVMHHSLLNRSCVDIDGVLCEDPTERDNDDGPRYQRFLHGARPLILPTRRIGWLVTCRLEKYRNPTEQWLQRHEVRYDHLIMMDLPDKASRVASGSHASFKAAVYRKVGAELFIESSPAQAYEIARRTRKPVLCAESMEMVELGIEARVQRTYDRYVKRALLHPGDAAKKALRLLGTSWGRKPRPSHRPLTTSRDPQTHA